MLGLHGVLSTVLVAIWVLLLNLFGARIYVRGPVAEHLYGELSERTLQVLRRTEGDLQLIAFFERRHPLEAPVQALLHEVVEAARGLPNLRVQATSVDPDRDVAVAGDLHGRFSAPPNSLVVATANSHRVILPDDLTAVSSEDAADLGVADFIGESAVAVAIWNLTRTARPVVYFLTGNGEHDPFDLDRYSGYSTVARHLRQDRYEVRALELAEPGTIPDDCAVLVLAGPRTSLGALAVEQINTYLSTGGRVLLLLDHPTDPGLNRLLESWGLSLRPAVRVRGSLPELLRARPLEGHPVTGGLTRSDVAMEAPCLFGVEADVLNEGHAHRPRVTVLARLTPSPGLELPSIALSGNTKVVAVAAERGVRGDEALARPARLVAVGDAQFASNAMTEGGYHANRDFFLATIHWLAEQDVLIGRTPVTFRILRAGIAPDAWVRTVLLVAVAWPATLALFGWLWTAGRRPRGLL